MSVYNPASSDQPSDKKALSRREFLYIMLCLSVSASAAAVCAGMALAVSPYTTIGLPVGIVDIPLDRLPKAETESPQSAPVLWQESTVALMNQFWLVHLSESIYAFSAVCPHRADAHCKWVGTSHRFECPVCGSKFTLTGDYVSGPAPRSLDQFVIHVITTKEMRVTSETGAPVSLVGAQKVQVDLLRSIKGKQRA